ncbi:hypothetical protein G6F31_013135 [Rhizopus arrhizus]|nr:hypothetical protein G6F31_013135 [Rhizopus arrhizus]
MKVVPRRESSMGAGAAKGARHGSIDQLRGAALDRLHVDIGPPQFQPQHAGQQVGQQGADAVEDRAQRGQDRLQQRAQQPAAADAAIGPL